MNKKILELAAKCQHDLDTSMKIKMAQRLALESQESQFYYSEQDVRALLKELSPFPKKTLSLICSDFSSTHEYFAIDSIRKFLMLVKKKILTAGQKDTAYFDKVECVFMSGGSGFSFQNDRECTAKNFCIEFVDGKTRKQFSILFPVEENYYFRTDDDFAEVLKGTYKLFNLGLKYAEGVKEAIRADSYHPCICATNDVNELAKTLKTFLTTDELDFQDIYHSMLIKFIEDYVPYQHKEHQSTQSYYYQPYTNTISGEDLVRFKYSDEDKTISLVEKESIKNLLEHIEQVYQSVQYKHIKKRARHEDN